MSNMSRLLSRRTLLRSAGIAPLVALGNRVMAGEISHEDACECMQQDGNFPEAELPLIHALAAFHYGIQEPPPSEPYPPARYECIIRAAWRYFEIGADGAGYAPGLLVTAYNYEKDPTSRARKGTGRLIVERMDCFGPCGNHGTTNLCAHMCGSFAGQAAREVNPQNPMITPPIYEDAWDRVWEIMKSENGSSSNCGRYAALGAGC